MVIRNNQTGKEYSTTIPKWNILSKKAQTLFTIVDANDSGEVSEQQITNTSAPAAPQNKAQRPATGDKKQNAKNTSSKK